MIMADFQRIASLAELDRREGLLVCEIAGRDLHINLRRAAAANTLVVGFHGSVDRVNRPVPAFISFIPEAGNYAHQLLISDPSLPLHPELSMAWYAGDAGFPAQSALRTALRSAAEALGVSRVIYFGTSGGGFAALYYSWHDPGSLALVGNPQTSVGAYYSRHIQKYLQACWPGRGALSDLDGIVTDVRALYAQDVPNYVIYLQNSTDEFHLFGHMAPFLAGIHRADLQKRISFECTFPGSRGHNPVWSVFSPWLRAAIVAPSWGALDLIETRHRLAAAAPSPVGPDSTRISAGPSAADISFSNLLRDYQLRAVKEG